MLVVAPGYEPTFFSKVDPASGPLEARLNPRPTTNLPPSHIVLGRVVDEEGEPVENAVVSLDGLRQGDTTRGSPPEGTDPLAVTDARGEFFLSSREPFNAMNLEVEAQRLARKQFNDLPGGLKRHKLTITQGAALTGRLLKDGKPLKAVALGVVSKERSIENFTGDFVIGTMDDGEFLFSNLPPDRDYYLYGIMSSLTNHGAVLPRLVRVNGDGSTKDVGEVKVVRGVRLAGQVKLADGGELPPNTRLSVSSDEAWDVLTVELGADGSFDLQNVPPGTHNVSTRVKGYRFAGANASLDSNNPFRLIGQLNTNKTNLTILLEPGDWSRSEDGSRVPGERPQDLPLAGIEEKRRIANPWTLHGRVTDAESGEPLPRFRVTLGRRSSADSPWTNWQYQRTTEQSNGIYQLEISRNGGIAVLQIDAEGYLPAVSDSLEVGARGWDFKLRKGAGPTGVLLLPDGKPAAGVQVIYIGPIEQASMRVTGQLSAHSLRPGSETSADSDGRFRFAPKVGEAEIVASSSNGFIRVTAADLATNGTLVLQPWARVSGRLVRDGQPVAGENVDFEPPVRQVPRPWINFHGTRTDEEGRFTIENVPAGEWQLTTRLKRFPGSWTNQRQHTFTARPGESVDVGTIQKTDSATALK